MQILIQLSEQCEEWCIVELQGILETKDGVSLANLWIGDLHFDAGGRPQLIIGHHLLTGSCVKLDKPLAVMKKVTKQPLFDEDIENCTSYEIMALVKRKIIFKNRPKPIISKTVPIRI